MTSRVLLLVLSISMAAGCDARDSKDARDAVGRVAIVDLDEVFRRLGREAAVEKELSDKTTSVAGELEELRETLSGRRETKAKEFGEEPTDEQSQELRELTANLSAQFSQEQQKAQREIELLRVSLARRFREEVRPVAREVAAARGREIVMTKTDMVLYAPADADITDEVVERMLTASGKPPEAKKD